MAICTECGAIIHLEDMKTHKCKEENKAVKGKEKRPQTIEVDLNG